MGWKCLDKIAYSLQIYRIFPSLFSKIIQCKNQFHCKENSLWWELKTTPNEHPGANDQPWRQTYKSHYTNWAVFRNINDMPIPTSKYTYVYMYASHNNEKKRSHIWKSASRGSWKGLVGGKGRGNWCNYSTTSEIKIIIKSNSAVGIFFLLL